MIANTRIEVVANGNLARSGIALAICSA